MNNKEIETAIDVLTYWAHKANACGISTVDVIKVLDNAILKYRKEVDRRYKKLL